MASDDGVETPAASASASLLWSSSSADGSSASSSDTSSSSQESATGSLDFLDDAGCFAEPMLSFEMAEEMLSFPFCGSDAMVGELS